MTKRTFDQIVTIDFETFFSKDYSLRKKEYNTSGYVRDPQFKAQCVGIQVGDSAPVWVPDRNVDRALKTIDWDRSALLAHHAAFDGFIASYHFGIRPAYYLDTMAMGKALHSNGVSASLDSLARYYKKGNKLPDVLGKTKGVRDLSAKLMADLGVYCAVDTQLCREIFDEMVSEFSQDELDLIDLTCRMFCEPVLQVDLIRAKICLQAEQAEKAALLEKIGLPKTRLSSNPQFAEELRKLDVEPPTKISPTTGDSTYAFAKNDLAFQELQHHASERVRDLVSARLAVKSTINETRAARLISEGEAGSLPVYLNYYGAHTGRWSGGNKINLQNLQRGGELRKSILAPPGHQIVVADSAQIEARMLGWVARDEHLLDQFRNKLDVYKVMASAIYGKHIDGITKTERFVGKVAVLGLGYGMGAKKFRDTLLTGAMGPPVEITTASASNVVRTYRRQRKKVKEYWDHCTQLIAALIQNIPGTSGPLRLEPNHNRIYLPNGLYLQYPGLEYTDDGESVYYDYVSAIAMKFGGQPQKNPRKLYGGLLTENIVQALARQVIAEQMLQVAQRLQSLELQNPNQIFRVATMTHDEIVVVVPDDYAQVTLDFMIDTMRTPPAWCLDVPLDAEGGFARNYSK